MKLSLRPTTMDDLGRVRKFLMDAFDCGEAEPFLDPALMRWKYWERRGDWAEPRGYALEQNGVMVAHAGLWPMSFDGGSVRGVQVIDWGSAKNAQGAGTALLKKMSGKFDFMYSVGGAKKTRKILRVFGFVEHGKVWNYARPLRPVRHILTHPRRNWKLGPRLVRNILWSAKTGGGLQPGWKAKRIGPDRIAEEFYGERMTEVRFSPRPPAFFEYLLHCPALPVQLYGIQDGRRARGHFAIGVMRGQARVAGVWLRHPDQEAWHMAYALAQQVAMQLDGANEITVAGTAGTSEKGAALSGLRKAAYTPVYILNKKGKLALPVDFQFQLCDSDAFFLDAGYPGYWN